MLKYVACMITIELNTVRNVVGVPADLKDPVATLT
jgi:hypothetical protein